MIKTFKNISLKNFKHIIYCDYNDYDRIISFTIQKSIKRKDIIVWEDVLVRDFKIKISSHEFRDKDNVLSVVLEVKSRSRPVEIVKIPQISSPIVSGKRKELPIILPQEPSPIVIQKLGSNKWCGIRTKKLRSCKGRNIKMVPRVR